MPPRATRPRGDLDAERAVIGAVLLSPRTLHALAVEDSLEPDHFYWRAHQVTWQAMLAVYHRGDGVDVRTVTAELAARGTLEVAGGQGAIDALAGAVPVAGHARTYGRIVRDHALDRQLLDHAYRVVASVEEGEGDDARARVEAAERALFALGGHQRRAALARLGDAAHAELERLRQIADSGHALTGLTTGLGDLDELTGGLQAANLHVLAARPGMGKSVLALNIAVDVARSGATVLFFSLEMAGAELAQRALAAAGSYDSARLRRARVARADWPGLLAAATTLEPLPLHVEDSGDLTPLQLRGTARALAARERGLGLVVVDYLQLMHTGERGRDRYQEVTEISRELKRAARELGCAVLAVSQLSRAVEQRTDKRPILSDLRESGQIEQDADLVCFLYRDEAYNPESERAGEAELIVAKNRHGPAANTIHLAFDGAHQRLRPLARTGP